MLEVQEVRNLLNNFNMLKVYVTNLDKAIEYERSKPTADIIGAMCLTQSVSGMPFPPAGHVSNKTADVAQNYIQQAEKELQEMEQESRLIKNVLTQLECAVNSLSGSKIATSEFFFEGKKCKDLGCIFGSEMEQQRSERQVSRIIHNSLIKITKLINISKADYHYIASHERLQI